MCTPFRGSPPTTKAGHQAPTSPGPFMPKYKRDRRSTFTNNTVDRKYNSVVGDRKLPNPKMQGHSPQNLKRTSKNMRQ
ncbi:ORF R U2 [Macacine gammaherpesvirus 5]|nr:ORF R U2 [Macacine gammaherpesvirus 5]